MKSYNQVLAVFQAIANAHQQIRTYGSGDPAFIQEGIQYPLMWVVPDVISLGIDNEGGNFTKDSFKIIFADLLHEDGSNQNEVLSDQKAIAADVIAQLQLPDYQDIFTVESSGRGEPIYEDIGPSPTSDRIAGWMITVTLRVDYLSDQCGVPSTLDPSAEVGCPPIDAYSSDGMFIGSSVNGVFTVPDVVVEDYKGDNMAAQPYRTTLASTLLTRVYQRTPTGQTTSYATRDDAWVQQNYYASPPSVGYMVSAVSWGVLSGNNVLGNTNRHTDTLGGTTYANGLLIDHLQNLMWYTTLFSAATWEAARTAIVASTQGGFSDWYMPNKNEIVTLLKMEQYAGLNWAPFSITGNIDIWSSTTQNTGGGIAAYALSLSVISASNIIQLFLKSDSKRYLMCRKMY